MTIPIPIKVTVLQALEQMRGDDLYRARTAFKGLSEDDMNKKEYGNSGRTRAQIIAEYEAHEAKVTAAIAWINSL